MSDPWETEIRGLHTFFEAWYRGDIPNSDAAFRRVADTLTPTFTLITSSGFAVDRDQLLPMLRSEYGAHPDLVMSVRHPQLKLRTEEVVLATYEEHGTTGGKTRATLITAVLRRDPAQPNGLAWVHIHEVALPAEE